jgi:hypothetical protein
MSHRRVDLVAVMLVGALLILGACSGDSAEGPDGSSNSPYVTSTDTGATSTLPTSSSTSLADSTSVPAATTTMTVPDGGEDGDALVTVSSLQPRYAAGETVRILIENELDGPITALDQRGFCTIVDIDELENESWVAAAPCLSGPPPSDVVLAPGITAVDLPQPLPPGVYRARLRYSVGDGFVDVDALEAVSDTFTVG